MQGCRRSGSAPPPCSTISGSCRRRWRELRNPNSLSGCNSLDLLNRGRYRAAMVDDARDLTLVFLRRMDGKLDRVLDVLAEHGRRITSLEGQVASLHVDFAGQSLRMDRIE